MGMEVERRMGVMLVREDKGFEIGIEERGCERERESGERESMCEEEG